jgi:hypothetical protein
MQEMQPVVVLQRMQEAVQAMQTTPSGENIVP